MTSRASTLAPWLAFVCVLAGTLPSAPRGEPTNWDTRVKLQVARNFWDGRGALLHEPTPTEAYVRIGRGGRRVSYFPALACLGWIPTVALARAGGPDIPALPVLLVLSALAAFLASLGIRRGASPPVALAAAFTIALATSCWPTAALESDNLVEAMALAALLWAAAGEGRARDWIVAGLVCALAINARHTAALLVVAGFLLSATWGGPTLRDCSRSVIGFLAGLAPGVIGVIAWNLYRFGVVLWFPSEVAGHLVPLLGSEYWLHVAGLLVSPGKGLAWYSPLVVLALASPWVGPAVRRLAWASAASAALSLLFFARFDFWHGDWAWGPRYVVALNVVAFPVVLDLFQRARGRRAFVLIAAVAILCAMTWQALPLLELPVHRYMRTVVSTLFDRGLLHVPAVTWPPNPADFDLLYWTWENSPILSQLRVLAPLTSGTDEVPAAVLQQIVRCMHAPLFAGLAILVATRLDAGGAARTHPR